MTAHDTLTETLRSVWGHDSFRPGQRAVIEAVLSGRDALAVMPTGGGKSVTFQLPARLSSGCVVVISPLIALMSDQVAGARARGLRAAAIDSTLSSEERAGVVADVVSGRTEIVYCAPEGLERVLGDIRGARVSLLAVDEAHCISEWGHDFRPAYNDLARVRVALGGVPVLAVTATATPRVVADIIESLGLSDPYVHRGTVFRPNLHLSATAKDRLTSTKDEVLRVVEAHAGACGVVYCLSRRGAGALATHLRRHGVRAGVYHAGMPPAARAEVLEAFIAGDIDVVSATVAFGMGVDKADVRYVVHADMPGSLEAYSQEIGRAGRDGGASDCVLLYSPDDVRRRDTLARALPPRRRRHAALRVREVFRLATGRACRHVRLCAHFGEEIAACGASCDVCRGRDRSPTARAYRRGC